MAKLTKDLQFERGATYQLKARYRTSGGDPIDLTGCVITLTFKEFEWSEPIAQLSSENGAIVMDETSGMIIADIPEAFIAELKLDRVLYRLDVLFADKKTKIPLMRGTAEITW